MKADEGTHDSIIRIGLQPGSGHLPQSICAPSSAKAATSQVAGAAYHDEKGGDNEPLAVSNRGIEELSYASLTNHGRLHLRIVVCLAYESAMSAH